MEQIFDYNCATAGLTKDIGPRLSKRMMSLI